jgi:hypothetical protein
VLTPAALLPRDQACGLTCSQQFGNSSRINQSIIRFF